MYFGNLVALLVWPDATVRQAMDTIDRNVRAIALVVDPERRLLNTVTDGDIARRAYDLYLARGCGHGHDVDDWLRADRELGRPMSASVA